MDCVILTVERYQSVLRRHNLRVDDLNCAKVGVPVSALAFLL